MLKAQDKYYAIVEIKGRPYYVTTSDVVITMRMNELQLGDVISLDRVRELGSEDYILKGNPYIKPDYFTVTATVIEHPVSKDITRIHHKRRGRDKTVVNKNHHTALRISEIKINEST